MGEDATAWFIGALRDMWTPPCFGNPGKVIRHPVRVLGTADEGGVHTNSGVDNHAYALMVDGGTYNGQTISRHRPHQGGACLLPRQDRLPGAGHRLRRPRRRAGAVLLRPDRRQPGVADDGRAVRRDHHRFGLRPGRQGDPCGRDADPADAVQLPAAAGPESAGNLPCRQVLKKLFEDNFEDAAESAAGLDRDHAARLPTSPNATGRSSPTCPTAARARPSSRPIRRWHLRAWRRRVGGPAPGQPEDHRARSVSRCPGSPSITGSRPRPVGTAVT